MNFKKYYKQINESPDHITTPKGVELDYDDISSRVFMVLGGTIIYGSKSPYHTHSAMIDECFDIITEHPNNPNLAIRKMKSRWIEIINPDPLLFERGAFKAIIDGFYFDRIANPPRDTYGVLSGRFWVKDNGYISFWEKRKKVLKQLKPILELIKKLGYDPEKVLWETYHAGKSKLISYNEYIRSPIKKDSKSEIVRQKELAAHLVPGMKKEMDFNIPTKTHHSTMPEVQYKNLTTFGDSVESKSVFIHENSYQSSVLDKFKHLITSPPFNFIWNEQGEKDILNFTRGQIILASRKCDELIAHATFDFLRNRARYNKFVLEYQDIPGYMQRVTSMIYPFFNPRKFEFELSEYTIEHDNVNDRFLNIDYTGIKNLFHIYNYFENLEGTYHYRIAATAEEFGMATRKDILKYRVAHNIDVGDLSDEDIVDLL